MHYATVCKHNVVRFVSCESLINKAIFFKVSLNFIHVFLRCRYLHSLQEFFRLFLLTTLPLTSMEKWHFQNFVKVKTVVLEKGKDETNCKVIAILP